MDYFSTKEKYMIVHQHPKDGITIDFFDSFDEAKQTFYNNGFTCIDASLVKIIDSTDQEAYIFSMRKSKMMKSKMKTN